VDDQQIEDEQAYQQDRMAPPAPDRQAVAVNELAQVVLGLARRHRYNASLPAAMSIDRSKVTTSPGTSASVSVTPGSVKDRIEPPKEPAKHTNRRQHWYI
jgi:hypothetical protein